MSASTRSTARLVGTILLLLGIVGVAAIIDCTMTGLRQDQCYDDRRSFGVRGGISLFGGLFVLAWAWIEDRRAQAAQQGEE